MKQIPLSYFYDWSSVPDTLIPAILLEFAENGAENMVITPDLVERLIKDRYSYPMLDAMIHEAGMKWHEMHAPYNNPWELNTSERAQAAEMAEARARCLRFSADAGCTTCTFHLGCYDCRVRPEIPFERMRELSCRTLEKLIPVAEETGVIIALENCFERSDAPDEVLYLLRKFESPCLGCCFDIGHANYTAPNPDGSIKKYTQAYIDLAWRGEVSCYPNALEDLLPYIVTCHLHDNNGLSDAHDLPGRGNIDFKTMIPILKKAPRLLSMQCEVGLLSNRISIAEVCRTMKRITAL